MTPLLSRISCNFFFFTLILLSFRLACKAARSMASYRRIFSYSRVSFLMKLTICNSKELSRAAGPSISTVPTPSSSSTSIISGTSTFAPVALFWASSTLLVISPIASISFSSMASCCFRYSIAEPIKAMKKLHAITLASFTSTSFFCSAYFLLLF